MDVINTRQKIFDGLNDFIISEDTKVFGKLLARIELVTKIKNIPGDIVECGVFKGSGIFTFLKIKRFLFPNGNRKIIGFDFFDNEELVKNIEDKHDKKEMNELFESRNFSHQNYFDELRKKILDYNFKEHEFQLVKGDIIKTSKDFVEKNPGFKISLLYLDLDLDEPTYHTLVNFWERMSIGGIIVFDEYAHHVWSESKGVDKFIKEKKVEIHYLDYVSPTAYIVKS